MSKTSIFSKIKNFFSEKKSNSKNKPTKKKKKHTKKIKQLTEEQIKAKQERANQLLKEQLAKEKEKQQIRKQKAKSKDQKTQTDYKKPISKQQESIVPKKAKINKQREAESLATKENTVLFISATTKRLKVIEWRNLKQKVLLNKEREVRRTHKGGWSQEKFQRFVDSQKAKTPEWIESNLTKKGILRPPYDEIIIDCQDDKVRETINSILN